MASSSSPSFPSDETSKWQLELKSNSIPNDVTLTIASLLEVPELCSLGSCSRFWRDLCTSDCLWMDLSRKRWPSWYVNWMAKSQGRGESAPDAKPSSSPSQEGPSWHLELLPKSLGGGAPAIEAEPFALPSQGWKSFYLSWHEEMASRASAVIKFVKQCSQNDSIEVGDYLKAVGYLHSLELGFKDVKLFLLTAKHCVFLNLIGLHYAIFSLGTPAYDVMEALNSCQVSDRQVCVNWFKLGRWFYGFRLPDESRSRRVSLGELTMPAEEEVRNVLNRGAVYEVFRVQITPVVLTSTS